MLIEVSKDLDTPERIVPPTGESVIRTPCHLDNLKDRRLAVFGMLPASHSTRTELSHRPARPPRPSRTEGISAQASGLAVVAAVIAYSATGTSRMVGPSSSAPPDEDRPCRIRGEWAQGCPRQDGHRGSSKELARTAESGRARAVAIADAMAATVLSWMQNERSGAQRTGRRNRRNFDSTDQMTPVAAAAGRSLLDRELTASIDREFQHDDWRF